MLWRLLRFVVGAAIATAAWIAVSPSLTPVLARVTAPLIHLDARFREVEVGARDSTITIRGPVPGADLPADQLTYNVILLAGLFASNPKPWRDRNIAAFFISLIVVLILHSLALLVAVESYYVARTGAWGEEHYGTIAANVWLVLEMFWRLIGMFALVFACWWIGTPRDVH